MLGFEPTPEHQYGLTGIHWHPPPWTTRA